LEDCCSQPILSIVKILHKYVNPFDSTQQMVKIWHNLILIMIVMTQTTINLLAFLLIELALHSRWIIRVTLKNRYLRRDGGFQHLAGFVVFKKGLKAVSSSL
jgi:hypothetical protein